MRAVRACVCASMCMYLYIVWILCMYSPLLPPSRLYALDSTHCRASERESVDQCMAPVVMVTKRAPRTTSERSARRSCVSACPEYARARYVRETHAYARIHGRECLRIRTQDSLLRRDPRKTACKGRSMPRKLRDVLRARGTRRVCTIVKCFKSFNRYFAYAIILNKVVWKNNLNTE